MAYKPLYSTPSTAVADKPTTKKTAGKYVPLFSGDNAAKASTPSAPSFQTPTVEAAKPTASDIFAAPTTQSTGNGSQPATYSPFTVFGPQKPEEKKTLGQFIGEIGDNIGKFISDNNPFVIHPAYSPADEGDLIKLQKEYANSQTGYNNRMGEAVVSGFVTGITGGIVKPPVEESQSNIESTVLKVVSGVSNAVGAVAVIGKIGAGVESVLASSKTVVGVLSRFPTVARFAVPIVKNVIAFDIYGQMNPEITNRIETLAKDSITGVLFSGLGFVKNPALSGSLSFGLGYKLAKMDGASTEDALIQGGIMAFLDIAGRAKNSSKVNDAILTEKAATDTLMTAARERVNSYTTQNKITPKSTIDEIRAAYREAAKVAHPDAGGTNAQFSGLNEAYSFLTGKSRTLTTGADSKPVKVTPEQLLIEARDTVSNPQKASTQNPQDVAIKQSMLNQYQNAVSTDVVKIGDLATLKVIEYPDGKFGYAYDINTLGGSKTADFQNNGTFATRAEAVKQGKTEIVEFAQDKLVADPSSLAAGQFATISRNMARVDINAESTLVGETGKPKPTAALAQAKEPSDAIHALAQKSDKFKSVRFGEITDQINGQSAPTGVDLRSNTLVVNKEVLAQDVQHLVEGKSIETGTGEVIRRKEGETDQQLQNRYLADLIRFEERHIELASLEDIMALSSEDKAVRDAKAKELDAQVVESFKQDAKEAKALAEVKANREAQKAERARLDVLDTAKTGKPIEIDSFAGILSGSRDSGFRAIERDKALSYAVDRGGEIQSFKETLSNPFVSRGSQIDVLDEFIKDFVPGARQLLLRYQAEIAKTGGTQNTDPIVAEIDGFIKQTLMAKGYDSVVYQNVREYQVFKPKKTVKKMETAADYTNEIDRRVEKFRKAAGIVAQREGAGVRIYTPDNMLDTANTESYAKFNLNRAKGSMKAQAESAKKYAKTLLYENDPEFRSLVDFRDALLAEEAAKANTVNEIDAVLEKVNEEIKTLSNEITEYEKAITPEEHRAVTEIAESQIEVGKEEVLNEVNPTGSVFVEYGASKRASLPLGEDMTTLSITSEESADGIVKIYRGAPKSQTEINPGDFVTTNQQLAKDYSGTGHVISKDVRFGDVLDSKSEPLGEEYIYRPNADKEIGGKVDVPSTMGKITAKETTVVKVDPNTVYYHGTGSNFDVFSPEYSGKSGFFFTENKNEATAFAQGKGTGEAVVKEVHLDIKNPAPDYAVKEAFDNASGGNPIKMAHETLKAQGYDGIIRKNETVVFSADQIRPINVEKKFAPDKTSRIGLSIQKKAVEEGIINALRESAGFESINVKDQTERAVSLVNDDMPLTRDILAGNAPLPHGMRVTAFINAVEAYAKQTNDADLIYDLSNSPLVSETSVFAQEMRLMQERDPDSATMRLQEIKKARAAVAARKSGGEEKAAADIKEKTKDLRDRVKKAKPSKEKLMDFIDSIKC